MANKHVDPFVKQVLPAGVSFSNLAANATTTIKSGPGVLAWVSINTKGATGNTLTIYDNTAASGTKIATIDTTAQLGQIYFGVTFSTGLTVVSATGTAADFTVGYF